MLLLLLLMLLLLMMILLLLLLLILLLLLLLVLLPLLLLLLMLLLLLAMLLLVLLLFVNQEGAIWDPFQMCTRLLKQRCLALKHHPCRARQLTSVKYQGNHQGNSQTWLTSTTPPAIRGPIFTPN